MRMFGNFGRTLALLREMRGYSQLALSREARIGKSQLSKYENGRELPKLETLERVLSVLDIQPISFFYTVAMLDSLAGRLDDPATELPPLPLPLTLLQPNLDELFSVTVGQFLRMYRLQTEVQARLEALTPAARPRSRG
ncbi:MAG TPA: helix-turn-helix transcriptional regulator [Thermoanaerobaculia bacterium]|nr:helix-turn-helix transcriptional regulator [Thermoanaerobaculia bacterium]